MKTRNNGSRIFLTELMFAIFYFIVISAICVQCFAKSYDMSAKAEMTTQAVSVASNAAERFLGLDDFGDFTTYYDDNWDEVAGDGVYKVTGIVTEQDNMKSMSITVTELINDSEIYSVNIKKAIPPEE